MEIAEWQTVSEAVKKKKIKAKLIIKRSFYLNTSEHHFKLFEIFTTKYWIIQFCDNFVVRIIHVTTVKNAAWKIGQIPICLPSDICMQSLTNVHYKQFKNIWNFNALWTRTVLYGLQAPLEHNRNGTKRKILDRRFFMLLWQLCIVKPETNFLPQSSVCMTPKSIDPIPNLCVKFDDFM